MAYAPAGAAVPPADGFDAVIGGVAKAGLVYADLVRVPDRTGLRWGAARAMPVRDVAEFPMPVLHVIRDRPEGTAAAKTPKSGKGRRVPLPDALLPAIHRFTDGESPGDLLFTRPGGGPPAPVGVRPAGRLGRSRSRTDAA